MQYTDNEAALIGGLISTYFFQPAVSASLKDAYRRVLEHLHQNALTSSDLQQIRKAVNFLMPMCQSNRQTQRELMGRKDNGVAEYLAIITLSIFRAKKTPGVRPRPSLP